MGLRFPALAALATAAFLALAPAPAPAAEDTRDAIRQLIHHVNKVRLAHGLKPLAPEARLSAAAQIHSRVMATRDCFDHRCPEDGAMTDRLARAGYRYRLAAENIAAGMADPAEVVEGWMNSAGHRKNILLADAREVGAGYHLVKQDGGKHRYRHYWTMTFGARF